MKLVGGQLFLLGGAGLSQPLRLQVPPGRHCWQVWTTLQKSCYSWTRENLLLIIAAAVISSNCLLLVGSSFHFHAFTKSNRVTASWKPTLRQNQNYKGPKSLVRSAILERGAMGASGSWKQVTQGSNAQLDKSPWNKSKHHIQPHSQTYPNASYCMISTCR